MSARHIFTGYFLCLLFLSGCAFWPDKATRLKEQEALQAKIKHYEELTTAINSHRLKKDTSPQKIRELYGEPDEILSSASVTGKFELWNYEQITQTGDADDAIGRPIRLYFDNGKLVSWSY